MKPRTHEHGTLKLEFSDCPHTPVMVYRMDGKHETYSATYDAAVDLGELDCGNDYLTGCEVKWLEQFKDEADEHFNEHRDPE